MWLWKAIASFVLTLMMVVIGIGLLLPTQVHVEREIVVNAKPDTVYRLVSDFQAWEDWSPWAQLDPMASMQIAGAGIGQTMSWSSEDPKVGKGTQEIVAMDAPHALETHLRFDGQGEADARFTLVPENGQTRVMWSLDMDMGAEAPRWQRPLMSYLGLAMNPMIGKDYEVGLQNLKALAER